MLATATLIVLVLATLGDAAQIGLFLFIHRYALGGQVMTVAAENTDLKGEVSLNLPWYI